MVLVSLLYLYGVTILACYRERSKVVSDLYLYLERAVRIHVEQFGG